MESIHYFFLGVYNYSSEKEPTLNKRVKGSLTVLKKLS